MAAGLKPFLREWIIAVRGADHWSVTIAAKVGNAISKRLRPIASRYYPSLTGDVEAAGSLKLQAWGDSQATATRSQSRHSHHDGEAITR